MAEYNREDIMGKREENGKIKCTECMEDEDYDLEGKESFISQDDIDRGDSIFICDYCGKKL